jgi:hypothetical protein
MFAATVLAHAPLTNHLGGVGPIRISTRVLQKDPDFIAHVIVHEVGHYASWKSLENSFLLPRDVSRIMNMPNEYDYRDYQVWPPPATLPLEGYQAERAVFGEIRVH